MNILLNAFKTFSVAVSVPFLSAMVCSAGGCSAGFAADIEITVQPDSRLHTLSPLLTGAGIEDVNHEIYGGIYSQMIFGESFQEPSLAPIVAGFSRFGGEWKLENGELSAGPGQGNKMVSDQLELRNGRVEVEVYFDDKAAGNAGLITRVTQPHVGADRFNGYEISLYPEGSFLRLGKHRNNWELLKDVPCSVPLKKWIKISVEHLDNTLQVSVDGELLLSYTDADPVNLTDGAVGVRQWERAAKFRNLKVQTQEKQLDLSFQPEEDAVKRQVSSMWQPLVDGSAKGVFSIEKSNPFVGTQSQGIRYVEGTGRIGLSNRGLNRSGLYFAGGKTYEGVLVVRSEQGASIQIHAESEDGSVVAGSTTVVVPPSNDWQEFKFAFQTNAEIEGGRVSFWLNEPSNVALGYALLQPGSWGRFKDLPLRKDVVEQLQKQGITILRYGGSMINNEQYRWKKMIGHRSQREPYKGFWYPYSTNGWGIIDFMDLCEAAGFEYAPTFSMHESPQDMADFARYATEPATGLWGAKRAKDGRAEPYNLKYIQLGNEERVDEDFAKRFNERAAAIWEVKPDVQIVVGDFVYEHLIDNPHSFTGALSGITNMDGHRKILEFAKNHDKEIWFDIHIWTAGPRPTQTLEAMFTYRDALKKIANDANFKVITFEFNSNNHDQRRALGNALAINAIERDGQIPIATSANCLQPDGHNDNGWDQGLLFLNSKQVWLQPPGYVTQMYSNSFVEHLIKSTTDQVASEDVAKNLDYVAKASSDGKRVILNMVNLADTEQVASIRLVETDGSHFQNFNAATLTTLSGELTDANTAVLPTKIAPQSVEVAVKAKTERVNAERTNAVQADAKESSTAEASTAEASSKIGDRERVVEVTLPPRSVSSLNIVSQ